MAKLKAPTVKMPKMTTGRVKVASSRKLNKEGSAKTGFVSVPPTTVTPGVDTIKKRMKGK